jgi:hypothetical protein
MQVISLGGGVQSTALFLMNLQREIDPPANFAIFADTGWERAGTYQNIDCLNAIRLEAGFPPIWRVSIGDIRSEMLSTKKDDHMPMFTSVVTPQLRFDGEDEMQTGQLRRQCTNHYKIRAINTAIREEYGMVARTQWIGFSVDEVVRMAPSRVAYVTHRFPLIEKRMDRADCERWLIERGFPVPVKSSCIGCPYHTDVEWKSLSPSEWEDACQFDEAIRDKRLHRGRNRDNKLFLHRSLIPLREVRLGRDESGDRLKDDGCDGGCWI